MMKWIGYVFMLSMCVGTASENPEVRLRPTSWAQRVIGTELENFYKIDDKLYRSEQPEEEEMVALEKFGIKEVLNLRSLNDDKSEAENTKLVLHHIRLRASKMTQADLIKALKTIKNAKGPVLVHCWHGADRTGSVVAAYRVVVQGWSKKKAIDEMKNGDYGYHAKVFPNLIELIQGLEVEKMKEAIK